MRRLASGSRPGSSSPSRRGVEPDGGRARSRIVGAAALVGRPVTVARTVRVEPGLQDHRRRGGVDVVALVVRAACSAGLASRSVPLGDHRGEPLVVVSTATPPARASSASAATSARARPGPPDRSRPRARRGQPDHDDLGFRLRARRPRWRGGRRRRRRRCARASASGLASMPEGSRAREADAARRRDRRRAPGHRSAARLTAPAREHRRVAERRARRRPRRRSARRPTTSFGVLGRAATERLAPRRRDLGRRRRRASTRSLLTATASAGLGAVGGRRPTSADDARTERVARRDGERAQLVVASRPSRRTTTTPSAAAGRERGRLRAAPARLLGRELVLQRLHLRRASRSTRSGTSSGVTCSAPASVARAAPLRRGCARARPRR